MEEGDGGQEGTRKEDRRVQGNPLPGPGVPTPTGSTQVHLSRPRTTTRYPHPQTQDPTLTRSVLRYHTIIRGGPQSKDG